MVFLIAGADPSHSLRMAFCRSPSIRHYTGCVIIDIYKYINKLQLWKKVFLCGRKQYLPRHCLQAAWSAALPRMMAEIIRRRMKTYSSVPSEKTVSGESAVFRREAVMTGKLAGVRTVIGDAERKIRETGDRFLFSLSGIKRGKWGNRFFTPCYVAASLLSHTAFLPPFRMTIEGESFIIRETIRRYNEGNVNSRPAVDNIQYPVPVFLFPWKFLHFNGGIPFIKTTLMV